MRKYLKKKLLNLIDTLKKAERPLEELCQNRVGQKQCVVLLEEMQSCGIQIGEAIESTEGEGTRSVALLERYCELLWECLDAVPGSARQNILKEIQSTRNAVEKQIQEEFTEVCEILFLPYKASMWDSMESVYKAFGQREDCQCTVMPIPYYSKNPDGSLGQEYYEGELYPKDLNVTYYGNYDLAEHYPDVIIIHNPYDDMNYITSVHPRFYACKLRQYTDLLVYIPYFIINGEITFQFCQTPAVLLSDLVIVQSESFRETYIQATEEWMEHMGKKGIFSRSILEKRFQALGSPKADKALSSKREDFSLPEKWRRVLEGKRAVLYNTGVAGILQGNEQELNKIEDVIESFRRREDAVLWWRPHPLSETTCASMRPQLLERYQELVTNYKEEKNGIYDDTPDLYRAIAWTDFYYGDSSSLTALYGLTGKPVVMQNKSVLSRDGDTDLTVLYTASVEENGDIWFSARNFNGLFHTSGDYEEADYLGEVPCEKNKVSYLFIDMIKDGNSIWMIPGRGGALVKYDIKEKSFVRYELPNELELQAGDIKFSSAWLGYDKLCLIPAEQPFFAVFNIKTESWQIDDFWKRRLEKKYGVRLEAPYFYDSCVLKEENSLLLPLHRTNFVIEYSLQNGKVKFYRLGEKDNRFSFVDYNEGEAYLASRDRLGKLYRWKKDENHLELVGEYPEPFARGGCVGLYVMNQTAYMIPSVGKGMLKINLESGSDEVLNLEEAQVIQFYSIKELANGEIEIPITGVGGKGAKTIILNKDGTIKNKMIPKLQGDRLPNPGSPFAQITGNHVPTLPSGHILWEIKENRLDQMIAWPERIVSSETAEAYSKLFANPKGSCGQKTVEVIMDYVN